MAVGAKALHVGKFGSVTGSHTGDLGCAMVNLDARFPIRTELGDGIETASLAEELSV